MRSISKLLVANRGEIARRVLRSARRLGIATVAVYSDADGSSPHWREADEAVRLPGRAAADTYLAVDALVGAAIRTGADAVHPGYGFLSEHAGFARACAGAGLVFVGPPPDVIEAMGSKLTAKARLSEAGVPMLPTVAVDAGLTGSPGEGEDGDGEDGGPDGAAGGGTSETGAALEALTAAADALGWPVLVKASAGGGGRGMRVVTGPADLPGALRAAAREARAAFGDGTVFLEPYLDRPRHVEVQILGDHHGQVVHLFERECSIQRRHQKIVEECPSVAVDAERRAALGEAAVAAGRAIGYVGAGTVEFLLRPDGRFAFVEVNTRLQVEHPVTEAVTGLDLVELQLRIAEGEPLPPEVLSATVTGHAVEARLYAEDPTRGWQPAAGRIERFEVPEQPGVIRVDRGVEAGSEVTSHYDPMLAKVIAWAPTRAGAVRALAGALAGARLHGVTTNRDLLVAVLRHPEFVAGDFDTGFLERHDPARLGAPRADPAAVGRHALAAALAAQAGRRAAAGVLAGLPSGWRNNPSQRQVVAYLGPHGRIEVGYRFDRRGRLADLALGEPGPGGATEADGGDARGRDGGVEALEIGPETVVLRCDGVTRTYRVATGADPSVVHVDGPDGASRLVEEDRFPRPGSQLAPGALVAPLPGTVVRVAVSVGDRVAAEDVLVAIEAMKMEHEVRAGQAGVVTELHVERGQQVEPGAPLGVVAAAGDGPGADRDAEEG